MMLPLEVVQHGRFPASRRQRFNLAANVLAVSQAFTPKGTVAVLYPRAFTSPHCAFECAQNRSARTPERGARYFKFDFKATSMASRSTSQLP